MPIYDFQKKILVPPEGNINAKIAIIGEAATKDDIAFRRPFMGYAGTSLEESLRSVGIPRISCYLTYVIKEQPKQIATFFSLTQGGIVSTESSAFQQYVKELKEEIEKTNCNLYICIGPIALYAMTGMNPPRVGKRRGSIYESTLVPGKKCLAMISPASAIKNYIFNHYIMIDLVKAKYESDYPEIRRIERNLVLFPQFQEAMDFINHLRSVGEPVAFDLEVTNDQVSHISLSNNKDKAMSIVFIRSDHSHVYSELEEYHITVNFGNLVEDGNIEKIIQNALFDIPYIFRRYGIEVRGSIFDTMVAQAINYPDFLKGLDFLCTMYTDLPYYKDEGKRNMKGIASDDEFAGYSAKDSIILPEIREAQIKALTKNRNYEYALLMLKLIHPLAYMAERGVLIDTEALKQLHIDSGKRIEEIEKEIVEIIGYDINLASPAQIMKHFYVVRNIPSYKNRKTGRPSSDDNALQRIVRKYQFPEAILLREYRKIRKLRDNYYSMAVDEDQRVRCSWNLGGGFKKGKDEETNARYSRLSSSENIHGTGTNLQNQPATMKEFFLADPGHLLIEVDYKQADWRFVAYLSGDSNMISALEHGEDIHRKAAAPIFNKEPHQISDDDDVKKDPSKCAPFGNGQQSERFWGKKANHAFNYRQSAGAFALQMLINETDAKRIRTGYFEAFSRIQSVYWPWVEQQLRQNRTITNYFGRSYTFLDRWSYQLIDAATAFYPQSSVADMINQWGINEMWYNPEKYKGVDLLLQIHDSIVIQVPLSLGINHASNVLENLQNSLEQKLIIKDKSFFIPVDVKVGTTNLKDTVEISKPKTDGEGRFLESLQPFFNK